MTNRTSPKKVVKNIDKPKSHNIKWQIIKHFDPSTNYATNHKSLNIKIPINVDSDNVERHVPRAPYTNLKKQNATKKVTIARAREANSIDFKKNKKPCNDKGPSLYKAQPQQKNRTKPFIHLSYSSSSSSLEQKLERFSSHCKSLKSKSFHDESLKRPNQIKRPPKSAKTNVYPSQKNFKSITDSSLIERRLQLKSLKEEILENQRITSPQKYSPNSFTCKDSPSLQDLKGEILQAQTNNILHKKILITELRSEIGHYKKFNNFQVYNSYEGDLNKNPENEGRANKTKSIRKEQSTRRKDSISDEDFEELECGICSSSQNISDCQGRSSGERSKSGTGYKTKSIRKEQSTRRKDSISDEDLEKLECGICSSSQNISDCQRRSSGEKSKSGTGYKTKNIRKEQSTRRKDSISDEDLEKLECGICSSSQNISDCQRRSSGERSKSGTGYKTKSIRKEQSTRRKDSISDEDLEKLECGICSSSQNISDCQRRSINQLINRSIDQSIISCNCPGGSSWERSKSGTGYKTKSIQKEQSTRRKDSISDEDFEELECGICSSPQNINDCQGRSSRERSKSGTGYKTKSIQKEQSTRRKDSISDEDLEELECGICSSPQNISDCQGRSSRERSKSGTGNKTKSIRKEQSTRRKDSISDEDFKELECGICSSPQNISDCQGTSSRERSKSGTGNKTKSIRKEQSTRRKDSISDEDFEELECGICSSSQNISDCQGMSSRERSKSGTGNKTKSIRKEQSTRRKDSISDEDFKELECGICSSQNISDCQGMSSRERSKSGVGNKTKSIRKEQSTRRKDSISDEDFEKLECGICSSSSDCQGRSGGERSKSGTDKESTLDPTDRFPDEKALKYILKLSCINAFLDNNNIVINKDLNALECSQVKKNSLICC